MEMIKQKFAEDGVDVPSIFNDPNTNGYFAHGTGSVDIYVRLQYDNNGTFNAA